MMGGAAGDAGTGKADIPALLTEAHKAAFDKDRAETRGEYRTKRPGGLPRGEIQKIVGELEKQMKEAARNLEFERAAALRDKMYEVNSWLAEDESLKPWERIKLLAGEE